MGKIFRSGVRSATPRVKTLSEAQQVLDRSRALFLALDDLANELHSFDSLDDLYLKAVLMGRKILDIDRMGILLVDPERKWLNGTFGTDDAGNTTDEREFRVPFPDRDRLLHSSFLHRNYVVYHTEQTIYHMEQPVGHGWHAMYALWDGTTPLGFIACDNLLSGRPLAVFQKELFGLFGSSIGSLILQKRSELKLKGQVRTLTRVVARVAHEINTPLAALQSSSRSTYELLKSLPMRLHTLHDGLDEGGRALLWALLEHAATPAERSSPHEKRNARRHWEDELARHGWGGAMDLAESLAEVRFDEAVVPLKALLALPEAEDLIELVAGFANALSASQTVQAAVEKVDHFVRYLRRPEHYSPRGDRESVALDASLAEVVKSFQAAHPVGPSISLGPLPSAVVHFHPEDLTHLWRELLKNAVSAAGVQGQVSVSAEVRDGKAWIDVEDNGPGIPLADQDKIFQPFFTTRNEFGSLGLGLSGCRTIVHAAGGSLTFESRPGRTVFHVAWSLVSL